MKGKNKILLGCLALLLVLSIGYALFSETITINGTATAKGSFDIAYECTEMNSSGGATGNCSIKNGIITTTSELKMPNDLVSYTITLTNEGTIPALLKTATSPNNIEVDGYITGKAGDQSYYDANSALGASYYINYDGERLLGDTMVEEASIMLEPNESITVVVNHGWVDLGENQPVMPENGTSISYDISFGFEQSTAN